MSDLIVTLTVNPAIDKSCRTDGVSPDRKLRCGDVRREPGGGGLNVARAVQKLGGRALAVYSAGGLPGRMLTELLEREQIGQQPVPVVADTRENLTVFEENSERQFRFTMPGARLQEREWAETLQTAVAVAAEHDAAYLVASGSLPDGVPDDYYRRLASRSAEKGIRLVLDTSGSALKSARGASLFLVKPNLRELGQVAGRELQNDADIRRAASSLVQEGWAEVVVVSLGAGGVLFVTAKTTGHVPTPTVPVRSKVGAGDSTVAGIVLGLVRGHALAEAIRFGVAAGAAAVMTEGTELCRREDTERLFQEMPR